jgi:hypothetical protein
MKKIIIAFSLCTLSNITSVLGQCGTNILTNPGFDTPLQPLVGNNITGLFIFNGWAVTGSSFNMIRTDGSSYPSGPDNAKDGTQCADILNAGGTIYQDFTIASNSSISFGGYFSSREQHVTYVDWVASIQIFSMPSNTLISTSNTRLFTNADGAYPLQETWHYIFGTVTLPAGNYRYLANLGDFGNFDASFIFLNCTLPIKLLSFNASLQNANNARLQWQIATAENGSPYELQRCTDGRSFLPINFQTGNATLAQYGYTDNALPNGTYYYRLKMMDKDGKVTYSNVAVVKVGSKEQLFSVYPNPVKRGESLQVNLQNITACKIEIINAMGQIVYRNTAKQTGSIGIPISSSLAPGQYVVSLVSDNKVDVQKILIQ